MGPRAAAAQRAVRAFAGRPRLKAVVLGGTSGMGRALARRLSARGDAVFLLGNEPELGDLYQLEVKRRALENQLLEKQIALLEKSHEYRCCPEDEAEPVPTP